MYNISDVADYAMDAHACMAGRHAMATDLDLDLEIRNARRRRGRDQYQFEYCSRGCDQNAKRRCVDAHTNKRGMAREKPARTFGTFG